MERIGARCENPCRQKATAKFPPTGGQPSCWGPSRQFFGSTFPAPKDGEPIVDQIASTLPCAKDARRPQDRPRRSLFPTTPSLANSRPKKEPVPTLKCGRRCRGRCTRCLERAGFPRNWLSHRQRETPTGALG